MAGRKQYFADPGDSESRRTAQLKFCYCMHLVVDLSAHGFGHIAQTAPVVNELKRRMPQLCVTLRSMAPQAILATRFRYHFRHLCETNDVGMGMTSALDVDLERSRTAYQAFHHDWELKVTAEASKLEALKPDLLFSNVPYLGLAAARRAGIPAVAMCCLNWADIYRHHFADRPDGPVIHRQILGAYNGADCFLKLTPGMPMAELTITREIGPVAMLGKNRRNEIASRVGLKQGGKLVLVALGGISIRLGVESWPRLPGVRWLVERAWKVQHPDAIELESLELPFSDIFASCDALITKPGYGSFVEAACEGLPVLYVDRPDWPEARYLTDWLKCNGSCAEIGRAELERGEIKEGLESLFALTKPQAVAPTGVGQAADFLEARLTRVSLA
jgi:hypothetical protein